MKTERIFSAGGFYSFIVQSNAITHHEAMATGKVEVEKWLQSKNPNSPVKVLDLACGGEPITIAHIMGSFPNVRFHYVGIDINKDQVAQAKSFKYPENVEAVDIIEGNSWDTNALNLAAPFHLVFSGLNFHHGTPEELRFLARRIQQLMHHDGLLISHDFYRPERLPYLRRPDRTRTGENMRLIEAEILAKDGIILPAGVELTTENQRDWRNDFVVLENQHLRDLGAGEQSITSNGAHVLERDYPISASEMAEVLKKEGWNASVHRFAGSAHPLKEYFSLITGTPVH